MSEADENREKTLPRRRTKSKAVRSVANTRALTILWHPDLERIGEVARLDALTSGGRVSITRLEPRFQRPASAEPASLGDRHLSRTAPALELVANGDDDLVELRPGVLEGPTEIQGAELTHSRLVSPEELDRGIVLLLAREIVLCLHRVGPAVPRGADLGMIGGSETIEHVRQAAKRAADADVPVLIRGETGTGKELVARAIATNGRRAGRPFVAINMAAISPTTAVADMFGHERGAFTGAISSRAGFFGAAHGGTLFLDEIGATPLEIQALVLRALDSGEIIPFGSDRSRRVDVRIVAATDIDLGRAMAEGKFLRPLYERLTGYQISIPPLRARREDFGVLLLHFLRTELDAAGEADRLRPPASGEKPWLSAAKVAHLALGDWPGNVRGLRNAARQIVLASRGHPRALLDAAVEELANVGSTPREPGEERKGDARPPAPSRPVGARPAPIRAEGNVVTKEALLAALRQHRWSPTATAAALGIPRSTLTDLMERHAEVRRASALPMSELRRRYDECGGDLELMSERLMVSKRSLQLRLAANRADGT